MDRVSYCLRSENATFSRLLTSAEASAHRRAGYDVSPTKFRPEACADSVPLVWAATGVLLVGSLGPCR